MFYLFALFLLLLAIASGISLLLISFGLIINGSSIPFWMIYFIGFLACFGLMDKISTIELQRRTIQFASGFQILLGIIAAVSIFMDKLMIMKSSEPMILWVLFLFGTTIGIWGLSRMSSLNDES
ncbi:MAG: hypothetical protein OQL19_01355 [Gammaproteobacteria bacterium]|nr:hypothetical protein [Gammaproteobacteria bacterium]